MSKKTTPTARPTSKSKLTFDQQTVVVQCHLSMCELGQRIEHAQASIEEARKRCELGEFENTQDSIRAADDELCEARGEWASAFDDHVESNAALLREWGFICDDPSCGCRNADAVAKPA